MVFYMERGSSAGLMVQHTEESSKATKLLELVVINGQMAQLMKDRSKMVLDMVRVNTSIPKKESSIRESGSMECAMDKELSHTRMDLYTKVSGKEA